MTCTSCPMPPDALARLGSVAEVCDVLRGRARPEVGAGTAEIEPRRKIWAHFTQKS